MGCERLESWKNVVVLRKQMNNNECYTPKACSTVRPCGPNQLYIKHHNSSQFQRARCTLHAKLQKHSECSK